MFDFFKTMERQEGYPDTFIEELNIQCGRVILPLTIIATFAWLPYITIDLQLHPDRPLIIILRLGLTAVGAALTFAQIALRIRDRGLLFLLILGSYIEIATGIITGLAGAESNYIGGYLFILMLVPLVPLTRRAQSLIMVSSLAAFAATGFLSGMRISGYRDLYAMNDLVATVVVAVFFLYILGQIRKRSWLKSKQIERQQREIEVRNSILEAELKMARQIQEQLIPLQFRSDNLFAIYKPMDLLGGDFFDFIKFRDANLTGVFISDVSGHGVPAAFITAIMKSMILNSGPSKSDPAGLLSFLNGIMINLTSGHFITAFYGIYDDREKTITYANAGHNFPYLVTSGAAQYLSGKAGPPLAVLSNEELELAGKSYRNHTARLNASGRIVLYTDGIVEAVDKARSGEMFGDERLRDGIIGASGLRPEEFVKHLYGRVVEFRGSDNFEDDVCLICFDAE